MIPTIENLLGYWTSQDATLKLHFDQLPFDGELIGKLLHGKKQDTIYTGSLQIEEADNDKFDIIIGNARLRAWKYDGQTFEVALLDYGNVEFYKDAL